MILRLSAPSKTFLTGEYAVLKGGPALVLNTMPRFELRVRPGQGSWSGFPVGSPAHAWLEQRRPLLDKYNLEFVDPHAGAGGFGASGAQFLLAHCFTSLLQTGVSGLVGGPDLKAVWNDLQVLSEGRGSGADVLAQAAGQVAQLNMNAREAKALAWPYPELDFCIVRTGQKIATHEHLSRLASKPLEALVPLAQECVSAFGHQSGLGFAQTVGAYARALRELGWQSEESSRRTALLEAQDWCLAAKGCGALGADTLLFIYRRGFESLVAEFLATQGWPVAARSCDLASGLQLNWGADAH